MESNRKRKGFMKGKLVMSIYKATKPSSTVQYNSCKEKPSPQYPSSVGFNIVNQDRVIAQSKQQAPPSTTAHVEFIVNQDQVIPQQKVSILLPDACGRDSYGIIDNPYGIAVDEGVDLKAANYISSVRERFRQQRMNSEHKTKFQDM